MKNTALVFATIATLAGCAFRSPDMYRDDTSKVLATKEASIRACYDSVLKGAPHATGKVTVTFDVETEGGKFQNISVDKAGSTASEAIAACVTKNLEGLSLELPDRRVGKASYVYEFTIPATKPKS
jgi:hypothetical protein